MILRPFSIYDYVDYVFLDEFNNIKISEGYIFVENTEYTLTSDITFGGRRIEDFYFKNDGVIGCEFVDCKFTNLTGDTGTFILFTLIGAAVFA